MKLENIIMKQIVLQRGKYLVNIVGLSGEL